MKTQSFTHQGTRPLLFNLAETTVRGLRTPRRPEFGPRVDVWITSKEGMGDFWYKSEKGTLSTRTLLQRYISSPKLIVQLEQWVRTTVNDALVLSTRKFDIMSDHALLSLFDRVTKALEAMLRGVSVVRRLDGASSTFFKEWLNAHNASHDPGVLATLCAPQQASYLAKEEMAFLAGLERVFDRSTIRYLARRKTRDITAFCKNNARVHGFIERHAQSYRWITKGYGDEPTRPLTFYYRRIAELVKHRDGISSQLRALRMQPRSIEKKRTALLRTFKITANDRALFEIMRHAAYLKDVFRELLGRLMDVHNRVIREVGQKRKVSPLNINCMTEREIRALILDGHRIGNEVLRQRQRTYVMFRRRNAVCLVYGHAADRLIRRYFTPVVRARHIVLHGRTASPGLGTGRVRIVRNTADIPSFRRGEVLVVNNTTPDFMSIMKRASAIVAEEGGITTHVSVVSRELGVPCVVGLEKITSLLRNGDMVEVDANKGIVRKIS